MVVLGRLFYCCYIDVNGLFYQNNLLLRCSEPWRHLGKYSTVALSIRGDSSGLESISKPTGSSVGTVPCRVREFLNRDDSVRCRFWGMMLGLVGLVDGCLWPQHAQFMKRLCDMFVVCRSWLFLAVHAQVFLPPLMPNIVFFVVLGTRISNTGFISWISAQKSF